MNQAMERLLTPACIEFLQHMHRCFEERRQELLKQRMTTQQALNQGDFSVLKPKEPAPNNWHAGPIPDEVRDRRVEITGPVDRKMIINALNSGARVFMADFEDSNAPSWENCLAGQVNLHDAINRQIDFVDEHSGKEYRLNEKTAVLMVRPRGWHLDEVHFTVDDCSISASLFDFSVFLFHNGKTLVEQGKQPYFYLPKLECAEEAKLWNDVIAEAEQWLSLPEHTVKVTVLIETITAVFQMDEMIYALKAHIIGLNCGRWDYIFSYIKKFHAHRDFILPDRQEVSMTTPFLIAYVQLLIHTCHKRGIYAMGGMAAQIPIKDDSAANEQAFARVKADKLREVHAGHDGTWVAHPGLIELAMSVFDAHMSGDNQLDVLPDISKIDTAALLQAPKGQITAKGVQDNMVVALHYLRSWLAGQGCVPVFHLMEDAATAEICRAQLWQYRHWQVRLSDDQVCDDALLYQWLDEAQQQISTELSGDDEPQYLHDAVLLLEQMIFNDEFVDFLTLLAYPILNESGADDHD